MGTISGDVPRHVAIIMDGNGRWAKERGQNRISGHDAGMQAMKKIVKRSSVLGIEYLTVYAFSTENWKRSEEEVAGIFRLLLLYVEQELEELHQNDVVVNILGDYRSMPDDVVKSLEKAMTRTNANTGLHFNIALNYGSRAEIVHSVISLMKNTDINPESLTEEEIAAHLYTAGIPDPDLIIRPGGEKRLSNFLLWQAAYSELVFSDVLWPDFTPEEYDKAIEVYKVRNRRFGGR